MVSHDAPMCPTWEVHDGRRGPSSIISAQQINNGQAGMLLGRGSTSRALREQLRHDTSHSMSVLLVSRLGVFSGKFVQALRKSSDRRRKASSDL